MEVGILGGHFQEDLEYLQIESCVANNGTSSHVVPIDAILSYYPCEFFKLNFICRIDSYTTVNFLPRVEGSAQGLLYTNS